MTQVSDGLEFVSSKVLEAKRPKDIFGPLLDGDSIQTQLDLLHKLYLAFAKMLHPDHNTRSDAGDVFSKLQSYFYLGTSQVEHGTYNSAAPMLTLKSAHTYQIYNDANEHTPVVDAYRCTIESGVRGTFAVARSPKDNELVAQDYEVIVQLRKDDKPGANHFHAMLPQMIEHLIYKEDGYARAANIYLREPSYIRMTDAMNAYPDGVSGQDMAWMYRRLLDVLGYVHNFGWIHGGIVPDNILIGTGDEHNIKLINWHACVPDNGKRVPLLLGDQKYYPQEILTKQIPDFSSDLYMLSQCMLEFVRPHERAVRGFLAASTGSVSTREQNAFALRKEFTTLIEGLWGHRKYKPFNLPRKGH